MSFQLEVVIQVWLEVRQKAKLPCLNFSYPSTFWVGDVSEDSLSKLFFSPPFLVKHELTVVLCFVREVPTGQTIMESHCAGHCRNMEYLTCLNESTLSFSKLNKDQS